MSSYVMPAHTIRVHEGELPVEGAQHGDELVRVERLRHVRRAPRVVPRDPLGRQALGREEHDWGAAQPRVRAHGAQQLKAVHAARPPDGGGSPYPRAPPPHYGPKVATEA